MGALEFLVVVLLVVSNVYAAVTSTGFTVSLADIDYFLPPRPVAKIFGNEELQKFFDDSSFVPFTVVKAEGSVVDIASLIAGYADDDVWQEGFMQGTSFTDHLQYCG
jgi:hypothetical protein